MVVDYPQFGIIEAPCYLAGRIKLTAQRIRALSAQSDNDQFDPFAFAQEIGIEVSKVELPEACSGRLRTDKGFALIEINAKESRVRQRFTLCHELAHICFWSGGPVVKERGETSLRTRKFELEETLCDRIASELLMPSDRFVSITKRITPSYDGLRNLARHFDVSMLAIVNKIAKTKGHGWISAALRWVDGPDRLFIRGGDLKLNNVRQTGSRQLHARDVAEDAFKRAERLLVSNPGILISLGYRYLPLAMSIPEVIIWRGRSPSHLSHQVVRGAVFFAL